MMALVNPGESDEGMQFSGTLAIPLRDAFLVEIPTVDQYRPRLRDAVLDREEKDGPDEAEMEHEQAWSISTRLAALVLDDASTWPPRLIALVQEARELHPAMAPKDPRDRQNR